MSRSIKARFSLGNAPKILLFAALILVQGLFATSSNAHPHAWIDLRSTVVLNEDGHAIALEQEWLFDDFYTAIAAEAAGSTDWSALAAENLKNLRAHDYFTEATVNGQKVSLGTVREFSSEARQGRLWMRFRVPFAEPVDPKTVEFSYSIFDPTYYIEITHMKDDLVAFTGNNTRRCAGQIVAPKPSTDMVMLAQALDRSAKADNTLGRVFAEKVIVSCR